MNCRVNYQVYVEGCGVGRGQIVLRDVTGTADAGERAVNKLQAGLAHLTPGSLRAVVLLIQDEDRVLPEHVAVRGVSCHAWLATVPLWLGFLQAHWFLGVILVASMLCVIALGLAWVVCRLMGLADQEITWARSRRRSGEWKGGLDDT